MENVTADAPKSKKRKKRDNLSLIGLIETWRQQFYPRENDSDTLKSMV